MMNRLERIYQKVLSKVLRYQKTVLAIVLCLFLAAVFAMTRLGGEFIPALPEGDFAVDTRVLPGSNLNTSIEAVSKASKIILDKFPEVEKIVAKTGSSEVPTDPMAVDASDMMIILKHRKDWVSSKSYADLEAKIAKELEAIPGVSFGFQYPVAMRFNELISGVRQDVACKIFGEDLDSLAIYAAKVGRICNSVEGSEAVYVEVVTGMPQIVISYNRDAIAQYGLNISDINRTVNSAFAGEKSGVVYEGEKRFDLVVRLDGEKRKKLEDVQQLLISTAQGTQVPLNTVANIEIIDGPNQIQRENSQRRIIVGFNVRGRDIQTTVHELQQKVEKEIKLPTGYYITYGGAFENLVAAKERLYFAVPLALALIFILLYFAFGSLKQGLLIYSSIPLSAIGGIFALSIRGISFSVSAGVGFIALFGVAVLNGIVLVAEFNRLEKEGYTDLKRIVLMGTKTRLRPVLMTALVASLGFLPMALSQGEGAEVQRPLATVVIGGLLIATFLTLFVLPILYLMTHRGKLVNKKVFILLIFIPLFSSQVLNAQQPINLKQALDIALANNLSMKSERLKSLYQQRLLKSGTNIPGTNITGEYGQINSYYADAQLGLSQNINFPVVYKRQKNLLNEEWKSSVLHINLQKAQLKRDVSKVYFALIYLQNKRELLQKSDTLISTLLDKVTLRFNKGEINILEKSAAMNQRNQIEVQLIQLDQDIEILQVQFQLLLNTETIFRPAKNSVPESIVFEADSSILFVHPEIQYWEQQRQIAASTTRLEQARLLPDLTLGYNLMSMRGMGADDKVYNSTLRFHSAQITFNIPIFRSSQKARIDASKVKENIIANEYEQELQAFKSKYHISFIQYQKCNEMVRYYETVILNNAEIITATANIQLLNGDINYLEWVLLVNQAISIQSEYIEALNSRNNAYIELNFYTNK